MKENPLQTLTWIASFHDIANPALRLDFCNAWYNIYSAGTGELLSSISNKWTNAHGGQGLEQANIAFFVFSSANLLLI